MWMSILPPLKFRLPALALNARQGLEEPPERAAGTLNWPQLQRGPHRQSRRRAGAQGPRRAAHVGAHAGRRLADGLPGAGRRAHRRPRSMSEGAALHGSLPAASHVAELPKRQAAVAASCHSGPNGSWSSSSPAQHAALLVAERSTLNDTSERASI